MSTAQLGEVEIRHLVALRAVAEERSFGRAAARLGYTQSAISQQVAALERIVGEPLFERPGGPKPVTTTHAGDLLLGHAIAILDRLGAAGADLASFREGTVGQIAVGTFQSVSVRALPRIVGQLRRESPELRINLLEHDQTELLVTGIAAGELDCAFVVGQVADGSGVVATPIGSDPFLLVSPRSERLAPEGEPVPVERLGDLQLVGQTLNTCQVTMERHLRTAGVEPEINFRTGDNGAVQAMVAAGGYHAVMPRLAIDVDDPTVSVHPIDPPLPHRLISIATAAGRNQPPAVERFIRIAVEVGSELLANPTSGSA